MRGAKKKRIGRERRREKVNTNGLENIDGRNKNDN